MCGNKSVIACFVCASFCVRNSLPVGHCLLSSGILASHQLIVLSKCRDAILEVSQVCPLLGSCLHLGKYVFLSNFQHFAISISLKFYAHTSSTLRIIKRPIVRHGLLSISFLNFKEHRFRLMIPSELSMSAFCQHSSVSAESLAWISFQGPPETLNLV